MKLSKPDLQRADMLPGAGVSEDSIIVQKDGLMGVLDPHGAQILPMVYERVFPIGENAYICKKPGQGFCFLHGGRELFADASALWRYQQTAGGQKACTYMIAEKWGLFTLFCEDGRMFSDFALSMAGAEKMARNLLGGDVYFERWLSLDDEWKGACVMCNEKNKIFESHDCEVMFYPEGVVKGVIREGCVFLRQKDGSLLLPKEDDDFYEIMRHEAHERRLQVRLNNGKWGIADLDTGKIVLEPMWDYVEEYDRGSARVFTGCTLSGSKDVHGHPFFPEGGAYFYVNRDGLRISEAMYRNANPFVPMAEEQRELLTGYIKTLTLAKLRKALMEVLDAGPQWQIDEFIRTRIEEPLNIK